jgi:hypothetical protein
MHRLDSSWKKLLSVRSSLKSVNGQSTFFPSLELLVRGRVSL